MLWAGGSLVAKYRCGPDWRCGLLFSEMSMAGPESLSSGGAVVSTGSQRHSTDSDNDNDRQRREGRPKSERCKLQAAAVLLPGDGGMGELLE